MIHMAEFNRYALARCGALNQSQAVFMICKKRIAGFVKIEPDYAAECLANLLFAARGAHYDALAVREVGARLVVSHDAETGGAMLGHHDFEVVNAVANFLAILVMALEQCREM
jgi:hypothetical protein